MEPEAHRLDREAMLADRLAAAERVRREIEAVVAAAEEKRHAFLERLIAELRADLVLRPERERIVAGILEAAPPLLGAAAREPIAMPAGPSRTVEGELLELARAAAG